MRPVILTDVLAAARTLLAAPRPGWEALIATALDRAEIADRHRAATCALHPHWGNGSLHDALASHVREPQRPLDDPLYLDALILVLRTLRRRRAVRT